MEKNILTPEQAWEKVSVLKKAYCDAEKKEDRMHLRVGKLTGPCEAALVAYLKELADEPNSEELYLFIIHTDDDFLDCELCAIADAVTDKPYAEKIFNALINLPSFYGFSEHTQVNLLKYPMLLEKYWQDGNDLCEKAEVALLTVPNKESLISKYFSCGHGLCSEAQKKMLMLPEKQMKHLFVDFINTITEKNHDERLLCQQGFFMLLRDKLLFNLYTEKMTPFYKDKKYIFPKTIAFVAERKGWL